MKQTIVLILCAVLLCQYSSFSQPGAGWQLIFEDEFDGTQLDQSKWNYNYTWGATHNHRAFMDPAQVAIEDGKLKLTAVAQRHPNAPDGTDKWYDQFGYIPFDYTSGAVNTNGKFNFTYGYVEGSFKMSGTGTWPAFWTLNGTGEWPPEIDILECPHDRTNHHYYYHYGPDWQNEASFGGQHNGVDKSAGFHTYGVEWGPDYMHFYFDGQRVSTNSGRDCTQGKNMYLIINLAVGGWSGDPSPSDVFPSVYECEWVRVWQQDLNAGNWDLEDGELGAWGKWNNVSVTTSCARSGSYGLQLVGNPASSERLVEVEPNTTYILGGWAKTNTGNYTVLGVKDFGGTETRQQFTAPDWENKEFTFTTGASATTARIYFYQSAGTATACGDDFYLKEAVPDCNGVLGGTAYYDYCGTCVGGNTGNTACVAETLQAEAVCTMDGIVETTYTGYEGNAYVNIDMAAGAEITFMVQTITPGTENLVVRYANGGTTNRDCQLLVNGTIQHASIGFPATGGWTNWEQISTQVQLQAGENTITLRANKPEGGANIDLFAVTGIEHYLLCGTQEISLTTGWNLVSFYVKDENDMLQILINHGVKEVKTSNEFYRSSNLNFLNNLRNIEQNTGYMIYTDSPISIDLSGYIASQSYLPTLSAGWNIVGISENTSPDVFIQNQTKNVLIIRDLENTYVQNESNNSLTLMQAGKAYYVLVE